MDVDPIQHAICKQRGHTIGQRIIRKGGSTDPLGYYDHMQTLCVYCHAPLTFDLTTKTSTELANLLRTIPVSEWNTAVAVARQKDAYWRADLSSADLRSADLRSANLSSADLSSADLYSANLSSADLSSADLSLADLRSANLRSAKLGLANLSSANLSSANLSLANLYSANLSSANLSLANLRLADLRSAMIDGEPITVEQWCDIFDMPHTGKGLRVAFKRLPNDRTTGRNHNKGTHLIEWKAGRWIEAPDWTDKQSCGGGLHVSPTAAMTRHYSSEPLVVCVAFDPADAVILDDKLKLRKCKVMT